MTPNQKGVVRTPKGNPLDLYEAGDNLAPELYSSERIGQTATHSDRTLPDDFSKVMQSGWIKPSIQLGALLYLQSRGDLTLGGLRRLHRISNRVSSDEIFAALRHQGKISNSPSSFAVLLRWVNRPLQLRKFLKRERRRIGVGYRDKGSLPPSHSRNRVFGEQGLFYLGEEKEFPSGIPNYITQLVGVNGILLFRHVSDGWWRVLSPFERFNTARRMLEMTLAK